MISLALLALSTLGTPPVHPAPELPATQTPDPGASAPASTTPPLPFPHPLITEILFAVPTGADGDANADGSRHANGDEFIELINPHAEPINLMGYTVTDRNPSSGRRGGGFRFTFPDFTLPPGGVVLLFNGYNQTWTGPVGDADRAPEEPHDRFHGAYVFTMRIDSARVGLSNEADLVLLSGPDGAPVHCVHWGELEETPPAETLLVEPVEALFGGSIERSSAGTLEPHPLDNTRRLSPGRTLLAPALPSSAHTTAPPSR